MLSLPSAAQLQAHEARWRDLLRLAWWSSKAILVSTWGISAAATVYVLAWLCFAVSVTPNARSLGIAMALTQVPAAASTALLIAVISLASWTTYLAKPNSLVYLSTRRDAAMVLMLRRRDRTIEPINHVVRNVGQKQGERFRAELGQPLFNMLNATRTRLQAQVTSRTVLATYLREWGQYGLQHAKRGRILYEPPGWTRR